MGSNLTIESLEGGGREGTEGGGRGSDSICKYLYPLCLCLSLSLSEASTHTLWIECWVFDRPAPSPTVAPLYYIGNIFILQFSGSGEESGE